MKAKLEARRKAVVEENDKLEVEFKKLSDQSAELDRNRSAIKNRVTGNVRVINEIDALIGVPEEKAPEAPKPVEVKPTDRVPEPLKVDRPKKKKGSSKVIKPGQYQGPDA